MPRKGSRAWPTCRENSHTLAGASRNCSTQSTCQCDERLSVRCDCARGPAPFLTSLPHPHGPDGCQFSPGRKEEALARCRPSMHLLRPLPTAEQQVRHPTTELGSHRPLCDVGSSITAPSRLFDNVFSPAHAEEENSNVPVRAHRLWRAYLAAGSSPGCSERCCVPAGAGALWQVAGAAGSPAGAHWPIVSTIRAQHMILEAITGLLGAQGSP